MSFLPRSSSIVKRWFCRIFEFWNIHEIIMTDNPDQTSSNINICQLCISIIDSDRHLAAVGKSIIWMTTISHMERPGRPQPLLWPLCDMNISFGKFSSHSTFSEKAWNAHNLPRQTWTGCYVIERDSFGVYALRLFSLELIPERCIVSIKCTVNFTTCDYHSMMWRYARARCHCAFFKCALIFQYWSRRLEQMAHKIEFESKFAAAS